MSECFVSLLTHCTDSLIGQVVSLLCYEVFNHLWMGVMRHCYDDVVSYHRRL